MNNTDYNDYMLNLYRDCTMQVNTSDKEPVAYKINYLFDNCASVFNNNIAVDYLTRLNSKELDLVQKMETYPYMFWKTREGQSQITIGLDNLHEKYITEVKESIEASEKITHSVINKEEAKQREVNKILNGNLGDYGDRYGEGTLKQFSRDMLKVQLGLGTSVNISERIEKFVTQASNICKEAGINADFTLLPAYLDYLFEKTPIKDNISNIDFNTMLGLEKSEEKTKLKM